MSNETEYLSRRCAVTESVLLEIGYLMRQNFPELDHGLRAIGEAWTRQIDELDAEYQQSGQSQENQK